MMITKKILPFISSVNQVLLFIIALVVLYIFIDDFFLGFPEKEKSTPTPRGVEIHRETNTTPEKREPQYRKEFDQRIKDVLIFMIESDSVNPSAKHRTGTPKKVDVQFMPPRPRYWWSYNSDKTINILFVPEIGESYMLFEFDHLILEAQFARKHEDETWRNDLNLNLYSVVDTDTNQDGFLGEGDSINLYASDYNGKNRKLILKEITEFSLIDDNKVLITQGEDDNREFCIYFVESGEIKYLDTKI